ncbi:MAG: ECF transporter S component [Chloroflexota bacterium]
MKFLKSWKTRDILVLVVISLALVVFTAVFGWLREIVVGVIGVYGHRLMSPLIILIVYMAQYLVRRPGASIVSGIIMGLVSAPFAPAGLAVFFGYMIGAVLAEASYAIGRYQNYSLPFMMTIGLIYNLIGVALIWAPSNLGAFAFGPLVAVLAISAVAGLVGGWLIVLVGDGLRKSGALQSYLTQEEDLEIA